MFTPFAKGMRNAYPLCKRDAECLPPPLQKGGRGDLIHESSTQGRQARDNDNIPCTQGRETEGRLHLNPWHLDSGVPITL